MSEQYTTTVRIPFSLHKAVTEGQFMEQKSVVLRRLIERYASGEMKLNRTKERIVQTGLGGLDHEVYEKALARARADGVSLNSAIVDLLAQFIRDHEETVRAFEQFRDEHADNKHAA